MYHKLKYSIVEVPLLVENNKLSGNCNHCVRWITFSMLNFRLRIKAYMTIQKKNQEACSWFHIFNGANTGSAVMFQFLVMWWMELTTIFLNIFHPNNHLVLNFLFYIYHLLFLCLCDFFLLVLSAYFPMKYPWSFFSYLIFWSITKTENLTGCIKVMTELWFGPINSKFIYHVHILRR